MPFTHGLPVNLAAFLDTIAFSEIGPDLLAKSDDGYNVEVGSTPRHPILFEGYADHPRTRDPVLNSTAAGRYQIIVHNFDVYRETLDLPDFSPASQDAIAIQLINECHAMPMIAAGLFNNAVFLCSKRWASFPGSEAGQPQQKMADLLAAFQRAGGGMPPIPQA